MEQQSGPHWSSSFGLMMAVAGSAAWLGNLWKVENALEEITNHGTIRFRLARTWRFSIRIVSPVFVTIVLLTAVNIL